MDMPPASIGVMDFTGITWLDVTMAVITIVGLALTLLGLWWTWRQARDAKNTAERAETAADAAKNAVTTTRAHLMTLDMVNDLRLIRETIKEATRAIEDEDSPVAKHVLVQLSEMMHRAVALAKEDTTPAVPEEVLADLQVAATGASDVKELIAKSKSPKPTSSAKNLMPILVRLNSSLVQFETIQKYAAPEVSNAN